jgi:hypothetical protein
MQQDASAAIVAAITILVFATGQAGGCHDGNHQQKQSRQVGHRLSVPAFNWRSQTPGRVGTSIRSSALGSHRVLLALASAAGVLVGRWRGVEQDVALYPDLLDQVELAFKEVDVFLLALQDVQQQIA